MRYFISGMLSFAWAVSAFASQPPTIRSEQDERSTLQRVSMDHEHDAKLSRALGIRLDSTSNGIIISEVFVTMPAYSAGLCRGDKLLAINHRPVSTLNAAVQQTQNIKNNYVMVDVQRKDMRICRRVEVQDGHAQYVGSYKHGRTLALAINQFGPGVSDQFMEIARVYTPSDIDTMIIDLRSNTGGSRYEAQTIARLLGGSQSRHEQNLHVIILQQPTAPSAVHALADMLVQQREAEVWGKAANTSVFNEASGASDGQLRTMLPHLTEDVAVSEAPVQWNIASFRKQYPHPNGMASNHQMMVANKGLAPIVWGINGNAFAALQLVKSVL